MAVITATGNNTTPWTERGKHFAGAYQRGREARENGAPIKTCPYDIQDIGGHSQRYRQAWRDGWASKDQEIRGSK